ncbi:chemotaxis protein [Achromobacter denitrificans]|uniref:chemotaxis protein n=1 Tax=Achromobacter denitrificans TaxID=32002 RepID=UPI0023E8CCA3|nr:chemotaxis protein [Achromobacter denitrificans]MDF3857558.1 chemotaxis protein [Achromobacter denitrificans]
MPLPLILGAAALVSAAYGAKKGYDGYQKHSEADDILNAAKERYADKKNAFDAQEKATLSAIETLGREELEIGMRFNEFKTLADALLQQLNAGRQNKLEVNIPKHKLQSVESYSYTVVGVLGTAAGAGLAGAAAGFAVYGGVMALGAASTGTAISSLAGVAATNATLAAIGGGSLATGGLGMAGGTAILGAAVAGPVLAIAGWAYDSHGEEALKNAHKVDREVDAALTKLGNALRQLRKAENYAIDINDVLNAVYKQFEEYFEHLKVVNRHVEDVRSRELDPKTEMAKLSDVILRLINNGYALAAILVDLITTPLFRVKEVNGNVVKDENGVPVMATDSDGSMILNGNQLDQKLSETKAKAALVDAP